MGLAKKRLENQVAGVMFDLRTNMLNEEKKEKFLFSRCTMNYV